ncbi:cache domain-containing protein [Mumia sp. DW29H23]|uniref:PDC sensor domain-containing protein n=1 Tax=Mumia sp. DW29H23 TaxID=3421241 RepID=UPI003D69280D
MAVHAPHDLEAPASVVSAYFSDVFLHLDEMRVRMEALFAAGPVSAGEVSAAIAPLVGRTLADQRLMGSGFVAARHVLSDKALYLAWWQGENRQLLAEAEAPDSGDPLDYTRHEWFRVPARTGLPHVAGPYVDYVCTDEYVLTATAPVVVDGVMVGVVGADTLVETLELMLLPSLREAGDGATVVNGAGRAVVSQSPRIATGSLVDVQGSREVLPCGDLELAVVIPD